MVINGQLDFVQSLKDAPSVSLNNNSKVSDGFVKLLQSNKNQYQTRGPEQPKRDDSISRRSEKRGRIAADSRRDSTNVALSDQRDEKRAALQEKAAEVRANKSEKKETKNVSTVANGDKKKLLEKARKLLQKLANLNEEKEPDKKKVAQVEGELLSLLDLLSKMVGPEKKEGKQFADQTVALSLKKGSQRQEVAKQILSDKSDKELDKAIQDLLVKAEKMVEAKRAQSKQDVKKTGLSAKKQNGKFSNVMAESEPLTHAAVDVREVRQSDFRKLRAKMEVRKRAAVQSAVAKSEQNSSAEWEGRVRPTEANEKSSMANGAGSRALGSGESNTLKGAETFTKRTGIKEPRKLFQQIVQRATVMKKSGMSEMKLQLNPKFLGRVRMQLIVKDGAVTAKIAVANEGLRQLLSENLESLGRDLNEAGVTLQHMEINADNQRQQTFAGSGEHKGQKNNALASASLASETSAEPVRATAMSHDGNVDLVA